MPVQFWYSHIVPILSHAGVHSLVPSHVDHSTNFARNSVARRRLQEAQPQWTRTTNEIATNPAMAAVTPRRNLDSWFTPLSPANVHSYWVAGAVWS